MIRTALTTLARHAGNYATLLQQVGVEMRGNIKRRLLLGTCALVLVLGGVVGLWAALLLFIWELPTRNVLVLALATVLSCAGALCGWLAARPDKHAAHKTRLRQELQLDRELFKAWSQRQ